MTHRHWIALLPLLSFAACGDPVGPEALSTERLQAVCGGLCARQRSCTHETNADCVSRCTAAGPYLRGDALEGILSCEEDHSCDALEEGACDGVIDDLSVPPVHRAFFGGCERRQATCPDEDFKCQSDDFRGMRAYTEDFLRPAVACWDKPCDEVWSCVVNALAAGLYD